MQSISIKGIAIGAAFGMVASIILAGAIGIFYALTSHDPAPFANGPIEINILSWRTMIGEIGLAEVTMAGGYIAARIAKRGHLLNGILSSILVAAGYLYSIVTLSLHPPIYIQGSYLAQPLLSLVVALIFGTTGGYLCKRMGGNAEPA